MKSEVVIDGRTISPDHPPYVIAEMSANHGNDLNKAIEIIKKAKECGADAIKIQTYTANTLTIDWYNPDFQLDNPKSLWHGMSMYELYEQAHTPWDWHEAIFNKCKDLDIICFSSPFDPTGRI